MKRGSVKTDSEDLNTFSLAKEIELLRNEYAEKEKLDLFQQSRLQNEFENEKEAEVLGVPQETHDTSCEDETNPDVDELDMGLKHENDSESNENSEEEARAQESNSGETTESEDQMLTTVQKKVNRIVISPEKADEVLLLLDTMTIRIAQVESKFFGKLKEDIAGLQLNIDQVKKLLKDIPPSMCEASRSEFILEIGLHVEAIFCCLEHLTSKLVECHSREMCDLVDDLKTGLSLIKDVDYIFYSPPSLGNACKNYFLYEFTLVAIAAFIYCLALFLLADPLVMDVILKFYDEAFNF